MRSGQAYGGLPFLRCSPTAATLCIGIQARVGPPGQARLVFAQAGRAAVLSWLWAIQVGKVHHQPALSRAAVHHLHMSECRILKW